MLMFDLVRENTNNGVTFLRFDVVGGKYQNGVKNDYSILIRGSFFKYPRDTKNASASSSVFL